jgi:diguanylate cyclase (GGDEF)-like protein/PAS domain S-box-containing protein
MLNTLKGRTALAAALLAGLGIALVASLQANLSQRTVTASAVLQHQDYTARVAGEIDSRLRVARAALSEFAASLPGTELRDAVSLHYYLSSRVGIQQAFESVAVYDPNGRLLASRPSLPDGSIAGQPWFAASLSGPVVGAPMLGLLTGEPVIPLTYRVFDENGRLRGVVVGTLPIHHDQLFNANARDAGGGHFVLVTLERRVVLHPDARLVGRPLDALGPAAAPILAGLQTAAPPVAAAAADGRRSLYAFQPVTSAGWTLVGVVSQEEAFASLDRLSQQMLLVGLALVGLLIPAVWLLVARMLRPLDELRSAMRRLQHGGAAATGLGLQMRGATRELRELAEDFAALALARYGAEAALQQEKERAEVTLQSIGDAVVATDRSGCITAMNKAAERMTGWAAGAALGRPFGEVVAACSEADTEPLPDLAHAAMHRDDVVSVPETVLRTQGGRLVPVDNSAAPIHSASGAIDGAVVVLRDVAAVRAAARELSWRANHDAMTGLVNRAAYEQALTGLVDALQEGEQHAVVMIDLDQFKIVNDTGGHAAGDELLKQLASLLLSLTRRNDVVARLGGDEFAVLMLKCPRESALSQAERLRCAIADWRFRWEGQAFRVGASVGVVVVDESFSDAATVQKAVDMACYMAKCTGGNRVSVHTGDSQAVEAVRLQMKQVARVQEAIDHGRLRLYGQAIRPLDPLLPQGLHFEVLLRMVDEAGRLVPPGEFLPAAERYGLMDQIDRWVIEHAIAACARRFGPHGWHELDTVAINLSALTLRDAGIVTDILQTLERHAMPPSCLCVEITETVVLENLATVRGLLQGLQAGGVRVALDDFGVGMTSLSHLRELPVDVLKIDGSFVNGIDHDALNSEIVDAIQHIAGRLGMHTVAERVEHTVELEHLRGLGVHYVQGYLLARPAPLEVVMGVSAAVPRSEAVA